MFCPLMHYCQVDLYKKLYDSAYTAVRSENRGKALPILEQLLEVSKKAKNDSLFFKSYEQFAFYYFLEGDYEKSASLLNTASDHALKLDDKTFYLDTKNNLGTIFSKLDEFEMAKNMYFDVLKNSDKDENIEGYIAALSNVGSTYQSLKNLDSAEYFLNRSLKLSKDSDYEYLTAANLKTLAKNHLLKSQFDSTILIVDQLKSNFWDTESMSPRHKDDAMFYRAEAFYKLGKYAEAEQDIKETFELMKITDKDPATIDRLEFYSELLEKQKQYKKALDVRKEVSKLRDSFDSAARSTKVLEIEKKYQMEKKEKENLKLREETAQKDLNLAKKNNYILVGSFLFATIIIFLVLYQLRKSRNKNLQLKEAIEKRITLQKELGVVRENIAKDFHDDLGNKLARITALSDLMLVSGSNRSKDDTLKALKSIKDDSEELYKGTRDFMFSLKSNSDYLEEVVTYLSDFGEDYFSTFNIDFFVEKDIYFETKLPYYWNRQVIMIFKEAITNVAKHAEATKVQLVVKQVDNALTVRLKDDGKGFDIRGLKHKNGLNNMLARAHKIGCDLSILSEKWGTEIILKGLLPE